MKVVVDAHRLILYSYSMDKDYQFFQKILPQIISEHKGQFALIREEKIVSYFPSLEEALKSAYLKFQDDNFIIQEVTDEIRTNYINSAFLK